MVLGNTKVPFHILRNRIVQKCNGINNTSKVAAYNVVFNKRECGFFGFDLKGEEGVVAVNKGERASGGFVFVEKADKKAGLVNGYFAKDQTRVVKVASQRRVDDDDDDDDDEESDDELDGIDEDEWGDEDEYVDDDDFVEEEDEDDDDFQARKRK